MSGNWMQTIALGWLVLERTQSGSQLGLVLALQFLPMLFLGPWGGVVADRFNKRTILYVTQTLLGVLALCLGALVATDLIELWMLYGFALSVGVINAVDNPTRQIFVSSMVEPSYVKNAVTLNSIEVNLARAIGPSIGGILIATVGLAFCFIINAVTYIAVIAVLTQMRGAELHGGPNRVSKKGQLMEGWRYVLASPVLRNVLLVMAIIGTMSYEFQVSLPLLAQGTFMGDASSYAALLSAMGVGSVLGGLFAAGRKRASAQSLTGLIFLFGASLCLVASMPTLGFAIAGMILVGFFSINVTSLANTILQLESKPEMRGRVMALWSMAMLGSTPIGGPIVGYIGQYAGPRWGIAVGGLAAAVAGVIAYYTLKKDTAIKTIPVAESEQSDLHEETKLH